MYLEAVDPYVVRPRHTHAEGQAEVCLSGSLSESYFAGRLTVSPGEVLLHGRFDSHTVRGRGGNRPTLLTLPWKDELLEGRFRVRDPDFLAQLAGKDVQEAIAYLSGALEPIHTAARDWIDLFVADLQRDQSLHIGHWARRHGLRREAVSRGFRQEFGISPKRFALEFRARRAWREIIGSDRSLTWIAQELGFADLPHLSRSVSALTAHSPTYWRSSPSEQQDLGVTRSGIGLLIAAA
jgi:AraC-like DNA-binding protein